MPSRDRGAVELHARQPALHVAQPDATVCRAGPSAESRPGTGDHIQTDGPSPPELLLGDHLGRREGDVRFR